MVKGSLKKGLTLLELVLALALSVVIMGIIGVAIHLHLNTLDVGSTQVEEAQLARAVLKRMADDLRNAVAFEAEEIPAAASLIRGAPPSEDGDGEGGDTGAQQGADNSSGGQNTGQTGGAGGNATGGNATSGNATGGNATGGNATGGNATGGNATGGNATGGNATGGNATGGNASGGNASGGDSTGGDVSDDLDLIAETDSDEPQSIAESVVVEEVVGLYGNQYELQVDVSRLPRADEYQTINSAGPGGALTDVPGDVKTIAYYLRYEQSIYSDNSATLGRQAFVEESGEVGLVRRELDHAVTQWASTNNNLQGLQQTDKLLAPEVTYLEFRYYDGYEWLLEWDSEELGGLPLAVEIIIAIQSARKTPSPLTATTTTGLLGDLTDDQVYRLVVWMPGANRQALEAAAEEEALAL